MKTKILFVANVDWFFISHRLVIAEEAKKNGFEVFDQHVFVLGDEKQTDLMMRLLI